MLYIAAAPISASSVGLAGTIVLRQHWATPGKLQHAPPIPDLGQYPDDPIVVLGNKH